MNHYLRRARRLRAIALGQIVGTAVRYFVQGLSRLVAAQSRARARRRAIAELSALSDRTLADIGVPRGGIPFVVEAMLERRYAAEKAPQTPRLEAVETQASSRAAASDECCAPLAA